MKNRKYLVALTIQARLQTIMIIILFSRKCIGIADNARVYKISLKYFKQGYKLL